MWDEDEEADDDEWTPVDSWVPTADETARAESLGITTNGAVWGRYLTGRRSAMIRFLRGDHYAEVEDAHYGCVQYEWAEVAGEYDAATLRLALGDRFVDLIGGGE